MPLPRSIKRWTSLAGHLSAEALSKLLKVGQEVLVSRRGPLPHILETMTIRSIGPVFLVVSDMHGIEHIVPLGDVVAYGPKQAQLS